MPQTPQDSYVEVLLSNLSEGNCILRHLPVFKMRLLKKGNLSQHDWCPNEKAELQNRSVQRPWEDRYQQDQITALGESRPYLDLRALALRTMRKLLSAV